MPEINLDFTVETSNVNIVAESNPIVITPTDIALNVIAGGVAIPGGNPGELQYNIGGALGGVANTNYNGTNLYLGDVTDIQIGGGINGYFLQTDGSNNLTWAAAGGGGNGSPGGSNTQIQYNDNGVFGGNTQFTFNEVTGNVTVPGRVLAANLTANSNVNAVNGTFTGNLTGGSINGNTLQISGTILGNVITSNGNVVGNNLVSNNSIFANSNITANGNITASGNISANNATFNDLTLNSSNIHLGALSGGGVGGLSVAIGYEAARNQTSGSGIAIGQASGKNANGSYIIAIGSESGRDQQGDHSIAIGGAAGYLGQGNDCIAIGWYAGTNTVAANNTIVISATGNGLSGNAYSNAFYVKPIRNANNLSNILFYNSTSGEITHGEITVNNANNANFANYAGNVTIANQPNITNVGTLTSLTVSGNANFSANINSNGTLYTKPIQEKISVITTPTTGTYTYDLIDQVVVYNTTQATGNMSLNFRGNSTITANAFIGNSNSIVATYLMTTGGNAYGVVSLQIDGSSKTINWAGNAAPNTSTFTTISYTFTIIKTAANTYTVLGSGTRYG